MKYLLNIALVSALLLCACNKEEHIEFPLTLYPQKVSQVSDIRLFTNKQEIHDENIIKAFIDNNRKRFTGFDTIDFSSILDILSNEKFSNDSSSNIYFLSKDTALFGTMTSKFTVEKKDNQFLFYSPLYVSTHYHPSITKYTATELIPPNSYITREVRVGYGSYENIEICFLAYMKTSTYNIENARLLNEFNEDYINTLSLTDTLAIREYRIQFIAK
ncbi:MAG: hypothetical protein LBR45_04890 [Bacteroidales bacterium]|jgi:hypothetical protein|nr:hypothetical protein [Bacteroidales bacterium]